MPYLPPGVLNDTDFPTAGRCDLDLLTTLGLISERWQSAFPEVDYSMIAWTPTPALAENDYISGVPGETRVDDLWGEDIDPGQALPDRGDGAPPIGFDEAAGASFGQAHGNPSLSATGNRKWREAAKVHAQVTSGASTKVIRRLGLDDFKGLVLTVPTVLMDRAGLIASHGDRFVWDGEPWDVVQVFVRDRWLNTNVYLYVHVTAQRGRDNSS